MNSGFGITIGVVKNPKETTPENSEQKYIANLTQANTDNPKVYLLKNTLGFEIVWTRIEANKFVGTSEFKFTPNRTKILFNKPETTSKIYRKNSSQIIIETSDNSLNETTVEIEIIEANGLFSEEFNELFN